MPLMLHTDSVKFGLESTAMPVLSSKVVLDVLVSCSSFGQDGAVGRLITSSMYVYHNGLDRK